MSSALFWIDFFMHPANIFMLGGTAAVLAWSISGGVFYTFGLNRMLGIKIMSVISILIFITCVGCWLRPGHLVQHPAGTAFGYYTMNDIPLASKIIAYGILITVIVIMVTFTIYILNL